MKPGLKRLIVFAGVYLAAFVFAMLFTGDVHRRDFDKAHFAWVKNPTSETRAELDRQMALNARVQFGIDGVIALVLTGLSFAGYIGYRRFRPWQKSDPH